MYRGAHRFAACYPAQFNAEVVSKLPQVSAIGPAIHRPKIGWEMVGGIPSRELTYPTKREKENHRRKSADWDGICVSSSRVTIMMI